ncbi:diaminopimelate epimerase [Legionella oakridgensis ATCC 33761 = DSM 21215]|uniref:Diaminopimelate epimerase n=1 Tax=Legionella oakridgensis ATCC 33761 = DSM 21215 TaxID=1268635 RepID=W0BC59_9GAMM|nr:hypothetical protein [Legionella oakridgensis]AHE66009.1 diaminopimelate epimerase [Legionella oakridgensis ATCC 33761 = DSM 21215]
MTIRFTKMHGLGNDFMVIDAIRQNVLLSPQQIATLSQRDTGIGFDQCLMVEASQETGIDFFIASLMLMAKKWASAAMGPDASRVF